MSTFRLPIIIYLLLILQGCRQNSAADGGTWPHVNDTVDAIIARLDSISFTRADIPADELAALDSMSDILPPGVLDFWHARAMRGSLSRDSATAILNRALKSADSASQPYITDYGASRCILMTTPASGRSTASTDVMNISQRQATKKCRWRHASRWATSTLGCAYTRAAGRGWIAPTR